MRPTSDLLSSPQDLLRHELLSQRNMLNAQAPIRLVAVMLAYAVSAGFLPIGFVITVAMINLLAEIIVNRLLDDVEPLLRNKSRHRIVLACTFVHEMCFALPPALIWQLDDQLAKAFAVGMMAANMMHIALVRSIHLPMGISGAAAIWIAVLMSNTMYWFGNVSWLEFAGATLCTLIGLSYFSSALLSNNRLHRKTYAGWVEAISPNAAKDRFLAQMSHELRTPLNAILRIGHAELARQTDPLSRSRMAVLVDSANSLGVLLDDILDLAAVQEGRLPIRPERIDPAAILTASVALFRPQAEAAGLQLELTLDGSLPEAARVDGQRLRQCVTNVLSNALKYTDHGSVRMTARMPADGVLQIEVKDTGQGVPEHLHETIFEPFQRGPGSKPGSGLGLTISRTLARRMGGDLQLLASAHGALFCLTVPLEPVDQPVPGQSSVALPPLNLRGHLILVVDDIASNRLVAATYLRLFGAEVAEADSGEAALRVFDITTPSAILLDMNMPGLNGVETLRRLRQVERGGARVPVIAMTADATEGHRQAYLAEGLDGYVAKPMSPEQLALALRPHLDPPHAQARPEPVYGKGEVG